MSEELKRLIILSSEVDDEVVQPIIREILMTNQYDDEQEKKVIDYKRPPIKFIINTPGGAAYAMLAVASVMKASKTPIHTYGYGHIMSAGLGLFALGHKRFADSHSCFMYHGVGYGTWGTIPRHQQQLKQMLILQGYYDKLILDNSDIKYSDMQDTVEKSAYMYISGDEALGLRLVDEIIVEGLERVRT